MGLDKSDRNGVHRLADAWAIPVLVIIAALLVGLAGDAGREWLRFDRVWLTEGETWRLITGHFAHLGWSHLALNSVALLLIWFLVGARFRPRDWFIVMATSILVMDIGFWLASPNLHWYVGLSGLLHGVLAAGIASRWNSMDGETWLLAVLLAAKLLWEQISGPLPGSEATSGGAVIVDAHLYGAIGGLIGAILTQIRVLRDAPI